MQKKYYSGSRAIADYLQPERDNYIPLVELPATLNPYLESHNIHLDIKLMNTLPLANVKSLPAWNMLAEAPESLAAKHIVESSSGNTVFSLGLLARHFGAQDVTAIASNDVSPGKLDLLRLAGVRVTLMDGPMCPDANDPNSTIAVASRIGREADSYNPGQYDNDANPQAHEKITGPQLYDQLSDNLGMFVAGLGTTGTLLGTARYLQTQLPKLKVAGIVRAPNNLVPGVRTRNGLREVALRWESVVTEGTIVVNEYDSFEYSLRLIREGLLVGPSTGFAYAGALKQLNSMEENGTIEELRGKHVVFIAPDSMFPYVSEYFEVLGEDHFPAIDDRSSGMPYREAASELAGIAELTVEEIRADYQGVTIESMRSVHYQLIDVRTPLEFEDHHLPDSENIPMPKLDGWLENADVTLPLVFICARGSVSLRAARKASQLGLTAYSMTGGTADWSDKDYPRVKALFC